MRKADRNTGLGELAEHARRIDFVTLRSPWWSVVVVDGQSETADRHTGLGELAGRAQRIDFVALRSPQCPLAMYDSQSETADQDRENSFPSFRYPVGSGKGISRSDYFSCASDLKFPESAPFKFFGGYSHISLIYGVAAETDALDGVL